MRFAFPYAQEYKGLSYIRGFMANTVNPFWSTQEDRLVYRPSVDSELCFVLLPLRNPFLGYFERIIKPAAQEAGLLAG